MISSFTRSLAKDIHQLFKDHGIERMAHLSDNEELSILESSFSDEKMLKDLINDLEDIAESRADYDLYRLSIEPLMHQLNGFLEEQQAEQSIRMVGDTHYQVIHAIHIGDKEIVYAEDRVAEDGNCYFVGNYTVHPPLAQYGQCLFSADYLTVMKEFTDRVSHQINAVRREIKQHSYPASIFFPDQCFPHDYSQSINGKVVALRLDALRPEYRRGDEQIVLVTGGNGARETPRGRTVFCSHLNGSGVGTYARHDILGIIRPEHLPHWVSHKLAVLQKDGHNPDKTSKENER